MKADIDVWGKCPKCGANWNMKVYSNITLSYVNKDGAAVPDCYKCPKCGTEWKTDEFKQTWK